MDALRRPVIEHQLYVNALPNDTANASASINAHPVVASLSGLTVALAGLHSTVIHVVTAADIADGPDTPGTLRNTTCAVALQNAVMASRRLDAPRIGCRAGSICGGQGGHLRRDHWLPVGRPQALWRVLASAARAAAARAQHCTQAVGPTAVVTRELAPDVPIGAARLPVANM